MIEKFYLDEWRQKVPWIPLYQVEQDLVISRALINLYEDPGIRKTLVFRGGTALNKIYFNPAARYSEDIDLVQIKAEPIGKTINNIRSILDPWLGEPKRKLTKRSVKLIYYYQSLENISLKLKIEINTTEHFHVLDLCHHEYAVESRWFNGNTNLLTYQINELIATKLRALYQRRKGRDLFDLWFVLEKKLIDSHKVVEIFQQYCAHGQLLMSKNLFEKNMENKKLYKDFQVDVLELIANPDVWSFEKAYEKIMDEVIALL